MFFHHFFVLRLLRRIYFLLFSLERDHFCFALVALLFSFPFVDTYPKIEISNIWVLLAHLVTTRIFFVGCLLIYRLLEMLESILCISFLATLLFPEKFLVG